MIKLEPLSKTPLSSQLYNLTDKFFSSRDFEKVGDEVTELSTGTKFILATEEEERAYKIKKEAAQEAEKLEKFHRHDNKKTPFIDYNNGDRWKAGLSHAKEKGYPKTEMCEDSYWHFLECVPPKRLQRTSFVCGEPYSHNNNGEGVYLCGIQEGERFFARYGTLKQFDSNKLF
tara:strand:+ start:24971 stop:25489 length:519 start_codon:yes stop_codon:yes gene_type:complete